MPRRRVSRFALEVLFLVAVATALTIAKERAAVVASVMFACWVVVALFEWAAWFDEPHFGRGLPPRYYLPQVGLPPPIPVEQRPAMGWASQGSPGSVTSVGPATSILPAVAAAAYPIPDQREEELTWIVPDADWGEVLDEWPVFDSIEADDETEIALHEPLEEPAEVEARSPVEAEHTHELDLSGLMLEEEQEELAEAQELEAEPVAVAAVVAAAVAIDDEPTAEEVELEPEPEPALESELEPEPKLPLPVIAGSLLVHHRIDPLAVPLRSRLRRRVFETTPVIEVPNRPPGVRPLPRRPPRED